jgi:hypothetical protein
VSFIIPQEEKQNEEEEAGQKEHTFDFHPLLKRIRAESGAGGKGATVNRNAEDRCKLFHKHQTGVTGGATQLVGMQARGRDARNRGCKKQSNREYAQHVKFVTWGSSAIDNNRKLFIIVPSPGIWVAGVVMVVQGLVVSAFVSKQ